MGLPSPYKTSSPQAGSRPLDSLTQAERHPDAKSKQTNKKRTTKHTQKIDPKPPQGRAAGQERVCNGMQRICFNNRKGGAPCLAQASLTASTFRVMLHKWNRLYSTTCTRGTWLPSNVPETVTSWFKIIIHSIICLKTPENFLPESKVLCK